MIRPSALSPARLFTGFAAAWLVLWGLPELLGAQIGCRFLEGVQK